LPFAAESLDTGIVKDPAHNVTDQVLKRVFVEEWRQLV